MYFSFRSFLEFNGGKMTDFGHHWMDVVHMYMGERAPHSAIFAGGIYYDRQDGRTAPDTCNALFEYDGFTVLFQSNAYAVAPGYGVTFYGDKGTLFVNRNRWEFTPAGRNAVPVKPRNPRRHHGRPRAQFPGLLQEPQAAERRCGDCGGFDSAAAAGGAIVRGAAAHPLRPGPPGSAAVLIRRSRWDGPATSVGRARH